MVAMSVKSQIHVWLVWVVKHSPLRNAYNEGRLGPDMRHFLAVNWLFQRVIGINPHRALECPLHFAGTMAIKNTDGPLCMAFDGHQWESLCERV